MTFVSESDLDSLIAELYSKSRPGWLTTRPATLSITFKWLRLDETLSKRRRQYHVLSMIGKCGLSLRSGPRPP